MNIPVAAVTRKTAILEIFRRQRADKVGTALPLEVLMAVWTQMGMRGDDLSNGLNELIEDGSLSLRPDHGSPAVALTSEGKSWLDGIGVEPAVCLEQARILHMLQQRAEDQKTARQNAGGRERMHIVDRRAQQG